MLPELFVALVVFAVVMAGGRLIWSVQKTLARLAALLAPLAAGIAAFLIMPPRQLTLSDKSLLMTLALITVAGVVLTASVLLVRDVARLQEKVKLLNQELQRIGSEVGARPRFPTMVTCSVCEREVQESEAILLAGDAFCGSRECDPALGTR